MLELNLRRRQGDFLLDVALQAGPGVTALFGPSGSGKTSVTTMVAGLSRPDHGRIVIDGRVLFDSASGIDLRPEQRRLGCVFQEPRLFPHLSVEANLRFGRNRLPQTEHRLDFDEVVEVLGIASLLGRRPAGLSGGEGQRVAIGRALLAGPRILLMDEPLAALDANRKAELLAFIARISGHFAIPILYVSHAMDEVLRLADTLALIEAGRVVAVGTPEDLLARPDLKALTGRDDPGSVVQAIVSGHDESFGLSTMLFAGGTLIVGRVDLAIGTSVRVRLHARDIVLAVEKPRGLSAQNIIAGTIRSLEPADGHRVDVIVDAGGCPLWAQITALSQARLGLRPGMPVHALIKAVTINRAEIAGR